MEHCAKPAVIIIVILVMVIAVDGVPRNIVQLIQRRQNVAQAVKEAVKTVRGPAVIIITGPRHVEGAPINIISIR
jgi:small-conductance mechanosensitive channel